MADLQQKSEFESLLEWPPNFGPGPGRARDFPELALGGGCC
jgi:hypothetical protein